jgi:PEP-CTERM motif-containing protein
LIARAHIRCKHWSLFTDASARFRFNLEGDWLMVRFVLGVGFSLAALLVCVQPAAADLLGKTVTGTLQFGGSGPNYFDPTIGNVPAEYLNKTSAIVVIGEPAVEFGYLDSANRDIANFTGNQLIVQDIVADSASNWVMTFSSPAFAGLQMSEISDTFVNGGVTGLLTGNTINLSWAGTSSPVGTLTVTFSLVPEPASLSLAVIGGVALFARRRKRAC